jgi:aminopeptidase-like protein
MSDLGQQMHNLCRELFPICRSITGEGFRQSLAILRRFLPAMQVFEVPSGTRVFDWEVPLEWVIRDAYVIGPDGSKVIDFGESNLHVVGYSAPVDQSMPLSELQTHLYSLPDQPDAIPYITSYYKERWGFCLTHNQRVSLPEGLYRVKIDSELKPGSLTYGELVIPGETRKEVFFSTYLCHPSMANNELSGPAVNTFLAQWLQSLPRRKYTYRFVFIPETIGSITYLSRNYRALQAAVVAGFNITCMGDERAYSYLQSRRGDTLADRIARHVLQHLHPEYDTYPYLARGSDERQYCSPGIDLPVCSVMRSMYQRYPEYHTSLDNLDLVTPAGLYGGYEALKTIVLCLEMNETLRNTVLCEPKLDKHGLYPTLSTKQSAAIVKKMMAYLGYVDGSLSNLEIAERINIPLWELDETIQSLKRAGLLVAVETAPSV